MERRGGEDRLRLAVEDILCAQRNFRACAEPQSAGQVKRCRSAKFDGCRTTIVRDARAVIEKGREREGLVAQREPAARPKMRRAEDCSREVGHRQADRKSTRLNSSH